ncbi:peroxiredoxin family protein [Polymorphobacter sp. PAMC 29334]|uniref:peroxiredoxin family protein n=1 Tax=Polymorphobacter sp. PAMC 29334 TaxID=2862331 RepID=UPI001C67B8F3|nr:peroxiredoxin family protein [Polymorphobacter sp. PAMC 29334]QYE36115.1 peroxiredoxin family protein [Polymorphobacter sp. PAMC 29334]
MRMLTPITAIVAVLAAMPAIAGIDIGPAVGAMAPSLAATVVDSAGKPESLASVRGKRGTVLMFFRSAKWCPYCQHQLIEFKAAAAPLAQRGYTLVAISYDAPDTLTGFAAKQDIGFTLLSDPGSKTIDAWKLRDPQYAADSFAFGVPRPAIFVIDTKGVIRAKLAEDGYKIRPSVEAVLAAVDTVK